MADSDPERELIWRFEDHLCLRTVEERLRIAGISHSRHATTVSYFLRQEDGRYWLDSYELHAEYLQGSEDGDPEVAKSYIRNSYGIISSDSGPTWIAETTGEHISEEHFYSRVIYDRPDRVLSLQQLSFETASGHYLLELNLESKILVLISMGGVNHIPAMIDDLVNPQEMDRSSYLAALFDSNGGALRP